MTFPDHGSVREAPDDSALRAALSTVLVAVAVGCSLASLRSLVDPGPWLAAGLGHLGVLTATILIVRLGLHRLRRRTPTLVTALLPGAVAAIVAVVLLLDKFGTSPGRWGLVGPADLARVGDLLGQARTLTAIYPAPIPPFEPVMLLVVGGTCLVLLLTDLLCNGLRMPALSGTSIALLWLPQVLLVPTQVGYEAVTTMVCLLALLAADNPYAGLPRYPGRDHVGQLGRGRRLRLRVPLLAQVLAQLTVVAAAGLALTTVAATLPPWAAVDAPSLRGTGGQVRVSDTLDLRTSLGARANNVVLRHDGGSALGPLRTATVTEFDGRTWQPEDGGTAQPVTTGSPLWPAPFDPPAEATTLRIVVADLRDDVLPLPTQPRGLLSPLDAEYDAVRDQVTLARTTARDDVYDLVTWDRDLTADVLERSSGLDSPASPDYYAAAVAPALELPVTSHLDDVTALAAQVTAGTTSTYQAAVALQDFLRDRTSFTYSLQVPDARTDDAVWDFLTDRVGYCVQFASAMTVMARTQGIPARMAIGFLPGTPEPGGQMVVRGRHAHAWPELYFDDVGWVRFEPTPGVQAGPPPSWADAGVPVPTEVPQDPTPEPADPEPSAPGIGEPTSADTSPGSAPPEQGGMPPAGLVALAVLTLGLVLTLVPVLRRRRRRRTLGSPLEVAWAEVLARAAALGRPVAASATVRTAARDIQGAEPADTGGADSSPSAGGSGGRTVPSGPGRADASASAIDRLAALVEAERFAPHPTTTPTAEINRLRQAALERLDELAGTRPTRR